ncbi:MAG: MBL fold metallo-hydrolase [Acidobacteriota bacterium]
MKRAIIPALFLCALIALFASVSLPSAAKAPVASPPPTEHVLLEGLKQACAWPEPDIRAVGTLINLFLASELDAEAFAYFEGQRVVATGPSRAWFTAAAGLFQVRQASSIPLLRRVAWVREGMAKLDAGVAQDGGLPRYLRGAAFASLPPRFDAIDQAILDLEWVLANADQYPMGIERGALQYLGAAYRQVGRDAEAEAVLGRSGLGTAVAEGTFRATPFSVSAQDGFRFTKAGIQELAEGVWLAAGFDFGAMAFIETEAGLVAIDAGTRAENAAAALAALRQFTSAPITHVILTHAHWDHIGGLDAFGSRLDISELEIIAQQRFAEELAIVQEADISFSWFFGPEPLDLEVQPTRWIDGPTALTIGGRDFELIPVSGGETTDGLLVHLQDAGLMFVGDVFMPYLGAPFVEEGNPRGLIAAIAEVEKRLPARLIHGHQPLTDNFTADSMPALRAAVDELLDETDSAIAAGRGQEAVIAGNLMPEVLQRSPAAVIPYLLMRDQLIRRTYDLATGYWQPDGSGIETVTRDDLARALEALGADEGDYAKAIENLLASGEAVMPYWLVQIARHRFPQDAELVALERQILERLRTKNQNVNPFKLIVYSEALGEELPGWGEAEGLF